MKPKPSREPAALNRRSPASGLLADSFAYSTIEDYEELVGFKVNEAFRTGWMMARTMNSHITALAESANDKLTDPHRKRT